MIYFPPLRRFLLPSLILLTIIVLYRSSHALTYSFSTYVLKQPSITAPGQRILLKDLDSRPLILQDPLSGNISWPDKHFYYDFEDYDESAPHDVNHIPPTWRDPSTDKWLKPLLECRDKPNPHTDHVRISSPVRNISMVLNGEGENERREYLNAAIFSLPYWSENQYLLVTRVQTDGSIQLNVICEANICYTGGEENARLGEKPCTEEDLKLLGGSAGMRCATPPITLNVPPTPAQKCGEGTGALIDIPGFHDPRIFWSGKGEPLMMVNTQSRYTCFGLWLIDLRTLHPRLNTLLASNPSRDTPGPLMSYPYLTEITRNPPESRGLIEKNWMMFSNKQSSYVHYDMGPRVRTFAKMFGGGLTTVNLTDPLEQPCLEDAFKPSKEGTWHQGTNSLALVLCDRSDPSCHPKPENTVFWSLIHHKHKNYYQMPLRYERYFIVWSSTPPFSMLAVSGHPMLLYNETASGWSAAENWEDDVEHQRMVEAGKEGKDMFAIFTYGPSIAYAWGRKNDQPEDKNIGYWDDEVILGLGLDDIAQSYARVPVKDLLQCMRTCPGRTMPPMPEGIDEEEEDESKNEEHDAFGNVIKKEGDDEKEEEEKKEDKKEEVKEDKKDEEKENPKEEKKEDEKDEKKEDQEEKKEGDKESSEKEKAEDTKAEEAKTEGENDTTTKKDEPEEPKAKIEAADEAGAKKDESEIKEESKSET